MDEPVVWNCPHSKDSCAIHCECIQCKEVRHRWEDDIHLRATGELFILINAVGDELVKRGILPKKVLLQ